MRCAYAQVLYGVDKQLPLDYVYLSRRKPDS